jgi:hypothetical protein
MADQPMSLGTALPLEMARVRDEVLPHYLEIGNAGMFAAAMMRFDLHAAEIAIAENDIVEMMRVYESLKGYRL